MKLGLFSVSYAGFWGQAKLPLDEFVDHAGRLGYPSVMVAGKRPHLSPLDADAARLQALKSVLRKSGVSCDAVAAYTDFSPGRAAEVPSVEFQIAYVGSLVRLAAEVGASVIRIFTAYESDGQDPQLAWVRVVSAIREICDLAARQKITIAIQNHHDLGLHTDALLELLTDIDRPNCKLGFDAWSPALRGENIREAARKAAPHTVLTTNADYIRVPRHRYFPQLVNYDRVYPDWIRAVPFGQGFIDYPGFFTGLREGGFDGLAVFEMCSPLRGGGSLENLDASARAYLDFMKAQGIT